MKNFRVHYLWLTVIFLLPAIISFSNIAQPGIRNAGGMGGFTLIFPEDSSAFQKVQMEKERVSIQLHKGFAVVKGEYWMLNHTSDPIAMQAGYPVSAVYSQRSYGSNLATIVFDKMYKIGVLVDEEPMQTELISYASPDNKIVNDTYGDSSVWYVWETIFKPAGTTKITVYFILNTNDSSVLEGYDHEYSNGFIYVLETGASWKPPIGEGMITVQLMDGLTIKDIRGVEPGSAFVSAENGSVLIHSFKDLVPTNENNLIITYSKKIENFDFGSVSAKSAAYFGEIDQLSKTAINLNDTKEITFDSPFDISNVGSTAVGFIFYFVLYGIPLLIGLLIVFFIYLIFKKLKRRKI